MMEREELIPDRRSRPEKSERKKYVVKACDRCRRRKQRCSGTFPRCSSCQNSEHECRYREEGDRRKTGLNWREERRSLFARLTEVEEQSKNVMHTRRKAKSLNTSSRPENNLGRSSSSSRTSDIPDRESLDFIAEHYEPVKDSDGQDDSTGPDEFDASDGSDLEPFGTGTLALHPSGKLYLSPEGTFYRPGQIPTVARSSETVSEASSMRMPLSTIPRPSHSPSSDSTLLHAPPMLITEPFASLASLSWQDEGTDFTPELPAPPVITPMAHQSFYLPGWLEKQQHERWLKAFFRSTATFGMNYFEEEFMRAMREDPLSKQFYYSPLLHLAALGIGARYDLSRNPVPSNVEFHKRGEELIEEAQKMMLSEAENPCLGTIIGLIMLSIYYFGMMRDQAATNVYAIAAFAVQEFRLHRRCDTQLKQIGLSPGGKLDIARRDVFGFFQNFSCWWTNYFGRSSLNLAVETDQKAPFLHRSGNTTTFLISLSFRFHCHLSQIGHELVFCQHAWRAKPLKRLEYARNLSKKLLNWYVNYSSITFF